MYPYITCCPNCAAMFNEHIVNCSSNENRIANLINKIKTGETIKKPNGNEVIEIIMDGKIFNLTFVQKHIIDIRSLFVPEKNKTEKKMNNNVSRAYQHFIIFKIEGCKLKLTCDFRAKPHD